VRKDENRRDLPRSLLRHIAQKLAIKIQPEPQQDRRQHGRTPVPSETSVLGAMVKKRSRTRTIATQKRTGRASSVCTPDRCVAAGGAEVQSEFKAVAMSELRQIKVDATPAPEAGRINALHDAIQVSGSRGRRKRHQTSSGRAVRLHTATSNDHDFACPAK